MRKQEYKIVICWDVRKRWEAVEVATQSGRAREGSERG